MNDNDLSFTFFIQSIFLQENMSDRIKLNWFSCFWKNFHIHNVHVACNLHNHNHVVCILHIHIHDVHSCSCIHSHSWGSCIQHLEEDSHCIHNHQSVWSENVYIRIFYFLQFSNLLQPQHLVEALLLDSEPWWRLWWLQWWESGTSWLFRFALVWFSPLGRLVP